MSIHLIRVDKPSVSDRSEEKPQSVVTRIPCRSRDGAMTIILKQWEAGEAPAHYEIQEI